MKKDLLKVKNLQIAVRNTDAGNRLISGLDFFIQRGETLALVGESGCGKTLTSLAILRLLPNNTYLVEGSQIRFEEESLLELSEIECCRMRGKQIGIVFQEPMSSLNPVMSIGEQIAEAVRCHATMKTQDVYQTVLALLSSVGIAHPETAYPCYPHQFSGGMKQRVMIAIAIASRPALLIADEPTSALDVTTQTQILGLLKKIQEETGMAILLITHDLVVVKQIADRIAVMYAGQIVEEALTERFFASPQHPYSQKLLAALPSLSKRSAPLATIHGILPKLSQIDTACRFAARCDFAWSSCQTLLPAWLSTQDAHQVRCHLYDTQIPQAEKSIPPIQQNAFSLSESADNPLLILNDIRVYFPIEKGIFKRRVGFVKAVDGVSLTVHAGRTLALIGESGCGKTTLGSSLVGLTRIQSGEAYYEQQNLRDAFTPPLRQALQMIFQDPYASLNPRMRIESIIEEGLDSLGLLKSDKYERAAIIDQLLKQVGLPIDCKARYPHEFSGGQRQRIAIARALAVQPKLIICDEPTSALDVSVQAQILNLLRKLQIELGLSYLFISHNLAVVAYMADDIAVMRAGKIVEQGSAKDILNAPQHPYTKSLITTLQTLT